MLGCIYEFQCSRRQENVTDAFHNLCWLENLRWSNYSSAGKCVDSSRFYIQRSLSYSINMQNIFISVYISLLEMIVAWLRFPAYRDIGGFQAERQIYKDRWKAKINFVEIRSFWHIFRSFDRMWSFFILSLQVCWIHILYLAFSKPCQLIALNSVVNVLYMSSVKSIFLQAMIIMAWSDSGQPTSIFVDDGFKKVLSLFITAAILKFAQGEDTLCFVHLSHRFYLSFILLLDKASCVLPVILFCEFNRTGTLLI